MTRSEIVGENIRHLRNARGMSQIDFAEAIDRSQSTVAMYENGQRLPSTKIMSRIANLFGVAFDQIYYSEDERKANKPSFDWYEEAFDHSSEGKLDSIGKELGKVKHSKQFIMLSEGLSQFEREQNEDFQFIFQFLTTKYPHIFKERNDDDDADNPES